MPQNEKNKYKLIGNNLFSLDYKEFYKSEVGPRQESKHVFVRHVDFKKPISSFLSCYTYKTHK